MKINLLGCKNSYSGYNYVKSAPSFSGSLEDDYYTAARNHDIQTQIRLINNIKFDIYEIDLETGDNFLHSAIKSGNRLLINKALLLLKQKAKNDEGIKSFILSRRNNENKRPLDYTNDENIINMFNSYIYHYTPLTRDQILKSLNINIETAKNNKIEENSDNEPIKLNELPEGTKIEIPFDDNEEEEEEISSPTIKEDTKNPNDDSNTSFDLSPKLTLLDKTNIKLDEIAGLTNAKNILIKRIIKPLENNKKVTDSGFLLYGPAGSGKGFLLSSIANTLDKDIIQFDEFEKLSDRVINDSKNQSNKQKNKFEKILDKNIIVVSDVNQLESLIDVAKLNYKNTGKQTIIYVDEIKAVLANVDAANSNYITKAEQLIEDSAKKGVILVATTRDLDDLSKDSIRSGRFDYKIELKFPLEQERKEFFDKYLVENNNLSDEDLKSIINKTAGFSYLNLSKLSDSINELEDISPYTVDNAIQEYAKKEKLGEISETGTTVNYDTKIKRENIKRPANFSEVAGMENIKYEFRKNLIERLKPERLEWFKKYNRSPISSGFLLYGPPGTGKTYIATALSGEMGIPLYIIDGSNIKDKYVGESEKNITAIFNQLEAKFKETGEYSILLIDEADSILAKRDGSNKYVDGLVNLFLQKINNSAQKGVITILATNYKDKIDEAVLSRLDTKIRMPLPDAEARKAIVKLEKTKYPDLFANITDEDIDEITARLSGFSSRDITQILSKSIDRCSESKNNILNAEDIKYEINEHAVKNGFPEVNDRNKTSAYDTYIKRLKITPNDPQTLSELGGMQEVKNKILSIVSFDMNNPEKLERYKKNKVKEQGGILLYGEPGCGKTYIMKALAAHLNLPIYEFKLSEQGSSYIHQTANNLGKIINQLKEKYEETGEKSILMLDEFEDIASRRDGNNTAGYKQEETDALLKEVQNSRENGIIIVAATNFYDKVDDAMKRRGRFTSIYVPRPDYESRYDLIKKSLSGREIAENILSDEDIKRMADASNGFSVVDITEPINQLVKDSIDNNVEKLKVEDVLKVFNEVKQDKNYRNEKE